MKTATKVVLANTPVVILLISAYALFSLTGVKIQLFLALLGLVALFATFMILLGRVTRRFEKSKEAQREFAEMLVQNSTVPTLVLDREHRVIIWNRACEELTGVKAAEVLGSDEPWRAFYNHKRPLLADFIIDGNPAAVPLFYGSHKKSKLIPEGVQAERWFSDLHGRHHYILFTAAPLRNKQGELVAAIQTIEDITERKEKEDQLRKLSQAVEQSPHTVVITDVDGSIEYVNPRFTELTGYAAEEVIGRNPRILQCGTAPEQHQSMWETITAGREWRGEFRNRKKNGECYWESASISPVKDEDGAIKHFIAIKEDITEKKLAEEQIRQTLSLLSATLESTADGILVRDLAGKVITHNRKFVEIWRIPESLLATRDETKMRMYVLDQLKEPQKFLEITENLYLKPDVESCDLLEFKDGRIIERVSKPQIIGDEIVGRVVSFRDISERTRAEVELGKVNRALRTLSACNRALVYATDERSLLVEICRSIVSNGGYRFAWVGYPLDDGAKSVRPAAWAGHEEGYLDAIQVDWSDADMGRGPVGTAIRTGAPSIVRDTAIDGNFAVWREEALKRGYSSVIGLPLANGKTFASLAIYAAEPDAFDSQEVELLQELASNLSYGITALRMGEERIKAERALHESEERYRSLLEHIDLGITLIDADHRILMVNSSICRTFDKPAHELLHKECFREFEKRTAPCPHCAGRAALETGKHAIMETEGVRDDGSRFHARINTFPVFDVDGKATRFIEVIQDITEQKQAEEALVASEKRFRHLVEQSLVGIYIIQDRKFVYVNPKMAEIFGYTQDELTSGMTHLDLTSEKDRALAAENVRRRIAGEVPSIHYGFQGVRKDGETIDVEVYGVSTDYNGKPAVIGTLLDVTERKLAEEAQKQAYELLRESEEKYMRVVDNIPVGVSIIGPEMEVLSINAQMKRWNPGLDVSKHPICFKAFNDPPRDTVCSYCPTFKTLQDGEIHEAVTETPSPKGIRNYKIISSPLKDTNGGIIAAIELVEDLTEQKQLEQQLRQSQKMEALGTLAGGIAHDFNNILTAITGYCTLIERKSAPEGPVRQYLDRLLASTDRAAALTQSLLAYSRKQPHDPQPVDLNAIIGKIDSLLSRLLGEDIELAVRPADGRLTVLADGMQVEQVLMNLATNARDAMPEGGILQIATGRTVMDHEFVKAHGYGLPGSYALITVSDTGCGIDEKTRERIFEPFFTTKEVGRGTGLGLSIAYGIVKQHNGYINVYSEPGKGTTFTIYLPLTDRTEQESPPSRLPQPAQGNETILLVEDDAEIRATLKELLEGEGYGVVEAVDGADGIEKFRKRQDDIQLLILDMVMPKKNGRQVFEEIKAIRPGIRAIFMSGYTADILSVKGVLQDDLSFVSKPIVLNRLLAKIREVLE